MDVNGIGRGLDSGRSAYSSRQWNLECRKNDEFEWRIINPLNTKRVLLYLKT